MLLLPVLRALPEHIQVHQEPPTATNARQAHLRRPRDRSLVQHAKLVRLPLELALWAALIAILAINHLMASAARRALPGTTSAGERARRAPQELSLR